MNGWVEEPGMRKREPVQQVNRRREVRRIRLALVGICRECGKRPAATGYGFCQPCADRANERATPRKKERYGKTDAGRVTCAVCLLTGRLNRERRLANGGKP